MTRRHDRLNGLLREVLAEIVTRDLKDPRLTLDLLSITEVIVSPDLRHARVRVSVMGSEEERTAAIAALNHSRAFVHRRLKPRLDLKHIPELRFERDDRIERDQAMLAFIDTVQAQDDALHAPTPDA